MPLQGDRPGRLVHSAGMNKHHSSARALAEAKALFEAGRQLEAIDALKGVAETSDSYPDALHLMGRIMAALGHADQAAVYFHKTVAAIRELLAVNMPSGSLGRLAERGFRPATVLDIGAYDGEWTRSVKALFPAARFVMVEALAGKKEELRWVAEAFPGGQVEVLIALLGAEQRQRVPFHVMETGSSVYEEQTTFPRQAVELPMTRLDRLLTEIAAPALMKIDVQGSELDVLAGAGALVEAVEVLILECAILGYNKGAPQLTEVLVRLEEAGFLPYDIADLTRGLGGILFHFDMVFVRKGSPLRPEGMLW